MSNVGIFVDVGNLYYCIVRKFSGRKLNYRKYLEKAIGDKFLYRAIAYGGQVDNHAINFINFLRLIGFETKFKEPKKYTTDDVDKREIGKADWDVGIAIDAITLLDRIDYVILGSADPDLVPLVEYIQSRGAKCHVFACGISRELRMYADTAVEIDESLLEEPKDGHNADANEPKTE